MVGQIADRLIGFAEKPLRNAGFFDGPVRKIARGNEPFGPAPDEEVYRPKRRPRRR
jgi:hypothetical protein